jgi:hypothetical protein
MDRKLFKPYVWPKVQAIQRKARAESRRDVPVNVLMLRFRLLGLRQR